MKSHKLFLSLFLVSALATISAQNNVTIKTIPVSNSVYMLVGQGGNIGVSVGDDGVFVIDDQFAQLTPKILEAIKKLVPYIKLVERERLRVPSKSEEAYNQFFTSDEFNGLFNDLILNKLAISQIMLLLGERPLSTGEISEILGLKPSEVSRHMNSSSRQGLVRYDVNSKCYARA